MQTLAEYGGADLHQAGESAIPHHEQQYQPQPELQQQQLLSFSEKYLQPQPEQTDQQHHYMIGGTAPGPTRGAASDWVEYEDHVGRVYWYNQKTGESSWVSPSVPGRPSPRRQQQQHQQHHHHQQQKHGLWGGGVAGAHQQQRMQPYTHQQYPHLQPRQYSRNSHDMGSGPPRDDTTYQQPARYSPPVATHPYAYFQRHPVSPAGSSSVSDSSMEDADTGLRSSSLHSHAVHSSPTTNPYRHESPPPPNPPDAAAAVVLATPTKPPPPVSSARAEDAVLRPPLVSPGSLSLSPVDTTLANAESRHKVTTAVAAAASAASHTGKRPRGTPPHSVSNTPTKSGGGRGGGIRRPGSNGDSIATPTMAAMGAALAASLPPASKSPRSSDYSPRGAYSSGSSSTGSSPVSRSVGNKRSPQARLAYALSPMGDPSQAGKLIEERKKARAARRKLLRAKQQAGNGSK